MANDYRASVNGSRPPTVAEVLAANEAAKKHRYTYPADVVEVPAGTKFVHPLQFAPEGKFEGDLDHLLSELEALMLKKHADYGPKNIADAPGGAINGLRVRMHDKLARINNLTDSGAEPNNESLEDSFKDLANYGIIGLMVLRGHWPGTEK